MLAIYTQTPLFSVHSQHALLTDLNDIYLYKQKRPHLTYVLSPINSMHWKILCHLVHICLNELKMSSSDNEQFKLGLNNSIILEQDTIIMKKIL
jgi:hypothetical protein